MLVVERNTKTNLPVNECALRIHEIEFVIQSGPGFGDGSGVREKAHRTLHFGEIAAWNHSWRAIVDADLEACRAPVNELNRSLRLDTRNGSVHVLGHDIASVQQTTGHVLAIASVTFHHLVWWLKARGGDFSHGKLLMVGFV